MSKDANVVGRMLAWWRNQRGLSQYAFVTKLHLLGCINMTRDILANIENLRCVATCKQIEYFAEALDIMEQDLFPKKRHFVGKTTDVKIRIFTRRRGKRPAHKR